VDISRERAWFVGIGHAVLDVSGDAPRTAREGLELMKREELRVCSLEAEVEFNAKRCRSSILRLRCSQIIDLSHLTRTVRLIAYSLR
jgi:hypothetical protein